jgi:hypothetical protein
MTLLNLFSPGSRARAVDVRGDRSVALILLFLLGLVFAPIIGLHIALAAVDPGAAGSSAVMAAADGDRPTRPQHR